MIGPTPAVLTANADGIYGNVTGANIDESKITVQYYVDGASTSASDNNDGSSKAPFKTITKAVAVALHANKDVNGSKIIVRAGEYREKVSIEGLGQDAERAPIVLEGEGDVVIKGSVDFSDDWTLNNGVYEKTWPYRYGTSKEIYADYDITTHEIVRRRDMLYINGKHLLPVLQLSDVKPGYFFVDEKNTKIYMMPFEGVDVEKALIETAVQQQVFSIRNIKNVVVRDIHFSQTNSTQAGGGIGVSRVDNVKMENCLIDNASYFGLTVHGGKNITLEKVKINSNGGGGLLGTNIDNVLVSNCETSYNNWRGDIGDFYDWDTGGIKILFAYDIRISGHKSINNTCPGIWFDSECQRITIEDCYVEGNTSTGDNITSGIYIEGNVGPILVDRCTMYRNRRGLNLASSNDILVRDSYIVDNTDCQIVLYANSGMGRTFKERGKETNITSYLKDTVMENVVISTSLPEAGSFFNYDYGDPGAYIAWFSTLKTSEMKYYHPNQEASFFNRDVKTLGSFENWKEMTGLDADAEWLSEPYTVTAPADDGEQGGNSKKGDSQDLIVFILLGTIILLLVVGIAVVIVMMQKLVKKKKR